MKKSLLAPSYKNHARARLYYLFDGGGLLILGNPELELFSSIHLYRGTLLCLRALQSQKNIPRELWVQVLIGEKNPISDFADLNQGSHPPHSLLQVSLLFVIHIAGMQEIHITYEGIAVLGNMRIQNK